MPDVTPLCEDCRGSGFICDQCMESSADCECLSVPGAVLHVQCETCTGTGYLPEPAIPHPPTDAELLDLAITKQQCQTLRIRELEARLAAREPAPIGVLAVAAVAMCGVISGVLLRSLF